MVSEGEEGNKLFAHLPVFICQASFLSPHPRLQHSHISMTKKQNHGLVTATVPFICVLQAACNTARR